MATFASIAGQTKKTSFQLTKILNPSRLAKKLRHNFSGTQQVISNQLIHPKSLS